MGISFSEDQLKAIEIHGKNLLVSAAAGSGKTAVLVERIVRMITDKDSPVDVDRLLVVTFTRAAASEMRERVLKSLGKMLENDPENELVIRQMNLIHRAKITTIDSFCMDVLRNHFQIIGIDPDFRMLDEGEKKLLLMEVMDALLEEHYKKYREENGEDDFGYLLEQFAYDGRDSRLSEAIMGLYNKADSMPRPDVFLKAFRDDYAPKTVSELMKSELGKFLSKYVRGMLGEIAFRYGELVKCCDEPDGPYMYGEMIGEECELLQKAADSTDLQKTAGYIDKYLNTKGTLSRAKDDSVNKDKRTAVSKERSKLAEEIRKLREEFLVDDEELTVKSGDKCNGACRALVDITLEFIDRVAEEKRERHAIDFSDAEHFALNILVDFTEDEPKPTAVARELSEGFAEIMIDEYQDSNMVQELILWAVSGEANGIHNRFMVGDIKQSIYGFRQARPDLFMEKFESYPDDPDAVRIDLSANYRSRSEVLLPVNDVFYHIMKNELCDMEYDEAAALNPGASYEKLPGFDAELMLIDSRIVEESTEATEAAFIADKIAWLKKHLQLRVVEEDGSLSLRAPENRDFVILHRSPGTCSAVYRKVFEEKGLALHVPSSNGYFKANEIQTLLNFLRIIDNPHQDIPLFGTLLSCFGGFSEDELAIIRGKSRKMSLYKALESQTSDEKFGEKIKTFLDTLDYYRKLSIYTPVKDLLQRICDDYDYVDIITAMPAGIKRRANVELLFIKAGDFEKTSYHGLYHFIRYIDQLEKHDEDAGEADILDENADVIRLMSIHKSKGLEFPIAFISGMGHGFNEMDNNKPVLMDIKLGIGLDFVDGEKRVRDKTLRKSVINRKLSLENKAEEERLLYVAMTRAKEKLIMVGTIKDCADRIENTKKTAGQDLSFGKYAKASNYLDFIMPIVGDCRIKITEVSSLDVEFSAGVKNEELSDLKKLLANSIDTPASLDEQLVKKRLEYKYAYDYLSNVVAKTTVSALKEENYKEFIQAEETVMHECVKPEKKDILPRFMQTKEQVSGTDRGNAYHRVMELMDYQRVLGMVFDSFPESFEEYKSGLNKQMLCDQLDAFLAEEEASGRLLGDYRKAVNLVKLAGFFKNEVAYRIWKSFRKSTLYREQPFVFGLDASEIDGTLPEGETTLLQGIIDAYFEEDGNIILIDYKTDAVKNSSELTNRYTIQLDYYKRALESLTCKSVTERYLYSFKLDEFIPV